MTEIIQPVAEINGMRFAGFWVRFIAVILDIFFFTIVLMVLSRILGIPLNQPSATAAAAGPNLFMRIMILVLYGAITESSAKMMGTPGKYFVGLKIIRPDGSKMTFLRALGRSFARFLSLLTFMIGFIMIALHKEKRGLHDIICDTYVVYK